MPERILRGAARTLARGVDLAFAGTALNPPRAMRRSSPAESMGHEARLAGLAAVSGFYHRPEFITEPQGFFGRSEPIVPSYKRVRTLAGGQVLDLRWTSEFQPLWSRDAVAQRFAELPGDELARIGFKPDRSVAEMLSDFGIDRNGELPSKYLGVPRNRHAYARWFRHDKGPRPCVTLVHGYMAGVFALEERVWPVQKLFEAGLDVVLTVLPFHGPRRSDARGFGPPAFPSNDPRFTIEGFRQLVFDHQALFDYLLAGRVSSMGVMGMSLGGYSAALLSTLDARLKYSVQYIPLSAIDEFALTHGRMVGAPYEQSAQRDALRHAQWAVSPLSRPSLLPSAAVRIMAGEADEVTGRVHAEPLARHFGTDVVSFEGGHLLQFGRSRAFAPVWQMLLEQGHIERMPKGVR